MRHQLDRYKYENKIYSLLRKVIKAVPTGSFLETRIRYIKPVAKMMISKSVSNNYL